jgi:hypothetical protein
MDNVYGVDGDLPVHDPEHRDSPLSAHLRAKLASIRTAASRSAGGTSPAEITLYTIDQAIADALEQLDRKPCPEPSADIAHWLWTGTRLVRASPEAVERIHQQEALEQADLQLLLEHQRDYRQQRRQAYRRLAARLVSPLRYLIQRW